MRVNPCQELVRFAILARVQPRGFQGCHLFKPLDLTTNIVLARVARESYNQTVSYYLERPRVVQCSLRREALARQRAWLIQKHERGSLEHTPANR